ncbi:MBL fold metallo-hydrolase [Winogradskyella ouciana]|uniref:MBL fold metallo-hydrolase n=1 Tax=Winogradskyella ouciana TaxID=2608631 RepID=A0A7K1GCE2_9FLAO|nr:MBL fold metallo-hydrolase [Winogradskyella ouciana]MTE25529.1 MBL fold metallo-hydrolase [Winogradskyella ouciana]
MKFIKINLLLLILLTTFCCKNEKSTTETAESNEKMAENTKTESSLNIIPIEHATFILESEDNVIYIDPTGGAEAFENKNKPTLVLITDIHGDHLNVKTLEALDLGNASIIAPKAVADKIPSSLNLDVKVLNNGEKSNAKGIEIEAIPMYNLREEALKFHLKGRGNGYVLNINNKRIYISGDTEDIPEMRNLKNIDKAFVCMNLPYTMPVESAADAVLDFKPKTVYPYHYRGSDGMSDVSQFKKIVNEGDNSIEVLLLEWY